MTLCNAPEPIEGRPAVHEITFGRGALAEGIHKAPRHTGFVEGTKDSVDLVADIAAVLLALASHSVDDCVLGRVIESIDSGVKKLLQGCIGATNRGLLWPREDPAANRNIPESYRPIVLVNDKLDSAEAFKIEGLEPDFTLAANESAPGIEVSIEEEAAARLMCLVHHDFHHCSRRRIDGTRGPANYLFITREGKSVRLPDDRRNLPHAG